MSTAASKTSDGTPATQSSPAFTIERASLLKSLGHVQSVVEKRGTIAVLSNVRMDVSEKTLSLTATDMDLSITETVPATSKKDGCTTVPAHMLYDIVRKLPDGAEIECKVADDGSKMSIKAGSSRFSLGCLPVDEFPVMEQGELPHSFIISSAECSALIHKPGFAMSTEETRYYLNGVYLHAAGEKDKVLRAVATDGHRLARLEIGLPAGAADMPGVIVPRKATYELRKLIEDGEGDVNISLSENKIRFAYGNAVLISKLIDGNFPDYERVIPSGNDNMMEVDCKSFREAVDRVSVIASDKTRAVKLEIDSGRLTLSATSAEHGNASEEIDITYSGPKLEIGFNSRYMLDMMANIEGDTAQFLFNDASAPALVRDASDMSSLYVIMPMRV